MLQHCVLIIIILCMYYSVLYYNLCMRAVDLLYTSILLLSNIKLYSSSVYMTLQLDRVSKRKIEDVHIGTTAVSLVSGHRG